LLREKNRLIDQYKKASVDFEDLSALKYSIEERKQTARAILDKLLLDEFTGLGIEYHQATWDIKKGKEGKPEKRKLILEDIRALQPFHWAYEFDEIIVNRGGFDAIITNPPWQIFKPIAREFFDDHSDLVNRRGIDIKVFEEEQGKLMQDAEIRAGWLDYLSNFPHVSDWFRHAPQFANQIGIVDGRKVGADVNLYKLFTEQCYNLLRNDGRCGIVIPSGIYSDLGAKQLRIMLLDRTRITGLFGFENRKAIFEGVHRSFKFVVLSFEKGSTTTDFPAAFMRLDPAELATFPESAPVHLSRQLIERMSPESLSLMEFKSATDAAIAEKMLGFPLLRDTVPDKWQVRFAAELHMTIDSKKFEKSPGPKRLPLYEGKMIWLFESGREPFRYWVEQSDVKKKGITDDAFYRIGIRSITGATNERTLVCSLLPKNVVCGNSLTVVKRTEGKIKLISDTECLYLLALLSSFTVDWNLRMKVLTNVNMFFLYQLPVPRLTSTDAAFRPLVERAARLVGTSIEYDDLLRELFGPKASHKTIGVRDEDERATLRAEIDASVAQLYGLTEEEFQHVLSTFPLVPETARVLTSQTYSRLVGQKQVA